MSKFSIPTADTTFKSQTGADVPPFQFNVAGTMQIPAGFYQRSTPRRVHLRNTTTLRISHPRTYAQLNAGDPESHNVEISRWKKAKMCLRFPINLDFPPNATYFCENSISWWSLRRWDTISVCLWSGSISLSCRKSTLKQIASHVFSRYSMTTNCQYGVTRLVKEFRTGSSLFQIVQLGEYGIVVIFM